jgi:hypothetical protein
MLGSRVRLSPDEIRDRKERIAISRNDSGFLALVEIIDNEVEGLRDKLEICVHEEVDRARGRLEMLKWIRSLCVAPTPEAREATPQKRERTTPGGGY